MRRITVSLSLVVALLATTMVAGAASDTALNARMIKWQQQDATVHLFVYTDVGRDGTTAAVPDGKPLLFGFEYFDLDLVSLEDYLATVTMSVSVDGGPAMDISDSFLSIFYSDGRGAKWSWDHDFDGRGDRDGDGIGDWPNAYIAPFRYLHPGLAPGLHTFDFVHGLTDGTILLTDTVVFDVG